MADDARHTRPDLNRLAGEAKGMDFFELLRQLEQPGRRFGRSGDAGREPARLGQAVRQSFATSDVAGIVPGKGPDDPPRIDINVLGLFGPEGPMPLHMTRWIMQRLSNRWFAGDASGAASDTSFLDFADLLQHRMIALYWRSWADARPDVHVAYGSGGGVTAMLRALAGVGMPGTLTGDVRLDGAKLHHATSLAQLARSPERLCAFLETVAGVPVTLAEFVGVWIDIPPALQTRLGMQHAGLGTGATAGARVFDRQSRAELRLGPLSLAEFTAFIDDEGQRERLRQAVVFASGKELDFGVRLVLARDEVPEPRLGECRLGRTTWLGSVPGRDADDLCFHRFTQPDPERNAA